MSPKVKDGMGSGLLQRKRTGPLSDLHADGRDSAFCPLLPGQDAGRGPGWATKGITQGWNRRAGGSPGQVSEPDRTQLSQDLGGGTLAIDTRPENGTRVVVSAGRTRRGRDVGAGGGGGSPPGDPSTLIRHTGVSFGVGPGGQRGERNPRGGDGSGAQPGSSTLSNSELPRPPPSFWTQVGEVTWEEDAQHVHRVPNTGLFHFLGLHQELKAASVIRHIQLPPLAPSPPRFHTIYRPGGPQRVKGAKAAQPQGRVL